MATHRFHEGALPEGYGFGFEPAFFDTHDYRKFQEQGPEQSYYLLNDTTRTVSAAVHFHLQDGMALSPLRAPFGSFDGTPRLAPLELYNFMLYVEERLKLIGIREVGITNPPREYAPDRLALLETFLLNQGYQVANAVPGAVIRISDVAFSQRIDPAQTRRATQARESGFQFQMLGADRFDDVFHFLATCYEEKGYPISIRPAVLKALVDRFPDRYLLPVVTDGAAIMCASISVMVTSRILYNFLVNHERRLNHLSPPVLLMEGLYVYCQREGIALLDLGTSALEGKPNFSLLDFKLRTGGSATSKLSFHKKLT